MLPALEQTRYQDILRPKPSRQVDPSYFLFHDALTMIRHGETDNRPKISPMGV